MYKLGAGEVCPFEQNTKVPITRRGNIWEYSYVCSVSETDMINMVVHIDYDMMVGSKMKIHMISVTNIDYIPLIIKLEREIQSPPKKIVLSRTMYNDIGFNKYNIEFE
jgi:hypothetical protein